MRNEPASFQRLMEITLGNLRGWTCFLYLDDFLIYFPTWEQHFFFHLWAVLDKLRQTNSLLRWKSQLLGMAGWYHRFGISQIAEPLKWKGLKVHWTPECQHSFDVWYLRPSQPWPNLCGVYRSQWCWTWSCVCANKVDYAEKCWPMASVYSTTENEC